MHYLFVFIWSLLLLLLITRSNRALEEIDIVSIKWDLYKFNATCEKEKCGFYMNQEENLSSQSCHCGVQCVRLGTCCIDSPYIDVQQPKLKPVCQSVYKGKSYFMINQCHSNDSVWANLCNEEWNGEDDLQKLVPVTSLLTSVTYKNYYCFRCYETADEFLYWKVKLEGDFGGHNSSEDGSKLSDKQFSFTYENDSDTWMASYDEDIAPFPVKLTLVLPSEIKKVIYECIPDVISECSDEWTGEGAFKCHGYMAIKEVMRNYESLKYKNLHCALCNFENLTDILCKKEVLVVAAFGFESKVPFSFTYLLDINRSDGELVGKVQNCASDHLWDPYTKKCKKLSCAIPGFKIKGGKCVQE